MTSCHRRPFPHLGSRVRLTTSLQRSSKGQKVLFESLVNPESVGSGYRRQSKLEDWLRRRSISRAHYGKNTIRVIRMSDPKAGFGRRSSPAPGSSQLLKQSRKTSPVRIQSERIPGTTGPASEMVAKKATERMEYRQQIRELIQASRRKSAAGQQQTARPSIPREREASPARANKMADAAVIEAVSSIASKAINASQVSLTTPEEQSMDFASGIVILKGSDIGRRARFPSRFIYRKVIWEETESQGATGYMDPGWLRPVVVPSQVQLIGADGCLHRVADHNMEDSPDCELRGISNGDLRIYVGLPIGRTPFLRNSTEHGRARTISGCLRHSGSKVPQDGARHNTHNGLDSGMDSGGWLLVDELLKKINRYVFCSRTRPALSLRELATLASDGTEQLTNIRWQFSMLIMKRSTRRTGIIWERVVKIFGIRAVVGHTAVHFFEDDKLMYIPE